MARPRPLLYQVRQVKTPYHGKSWKVTAYIGGKRKQHWFASEREAKTFANDSNAELHAYGSQLSDLSPSDRADSQRALDILKGHPEVSLAELAKIYVAQAAARSASKPLNQFLAEYETLILRRVASGELKSGSHKVIKETFVKLKTEFGNRILSEISSTDIERWLDRMSVGMRTKKRHRAYALQIFNAARKQKLVPSNPVEDVGYKGRKNDAEEITVLTAEKLQRLFACADPEILPLYAIAAFAGVRWNEIERLNWDDIKESEIVISARIAKTRSRRIIPIRPALAAFLTERGTGSVLPRIYSARRPSVRRLDFLRAQAEKQAGLYPWPRNALRHSFISYALAIVHDENRIALESGNTPGVIHTNVELEQLKVAIRRQVDKLVRLNRTRIDFLEKFEKLIESYNQGSRNIDELFQQLVALSKSLDEEQKRHVRENLTEEELTVFDILTRPGPDLSPEERNEIKKVAQVLLERLKTVLTLDSRKRVDARPAV